MSDSFEARVNEAVQLVTRDDSGKLVLPETVVADEALSFAVRSEVRRRDTQATYTKTQQQLKQVEAERDQFAKGWEKDFTATLPAAEQADLAELKATDPDAWRTKLTDLEKAQKQTFEQRKAEIQANASKQTEVQQREQLLAAYNESNPEYVINDEVLENDIPPRITKQLAEGKISFADFLDKSKAYLTKSKVVDKGTTKESEPNLSLLPGGSAPGGDAARLASKKAYKDEIF